MVSQQLQVYPRRTITVIMVSSWPYNRRRNIIRHLRPIMRPEAMQAALRMLCPLVAVAPRFPEGRRQQQQNRRVPVIHILVKLFKVKAAVTVIQYR